MEEVRKPCPACGEQIMAQAVICRFCKTDFRPSAAAAPAPAPPTPAKSRGLPVLLILLVVAVAAVPFVAIVAAIAIPGLLSSQRYANEMNASASMKTLCTAEMDFRANDRDGNGVNDFWTGDVSGLFCLRPQDSGSPLGLIEISVAAADGAPVMRSIPADRKAVFSSSARPKAGYFFRAMKEDESGEPYGRDTEGRKSLGPYYNLAGFAFCAHPAKYPSSGRQTFIVNESAMVWKKDTRGEAVAGWPENPEEEGWVKADAPSSGG
jgi:hypothetical protein